MIETTLRSRKRQAQVRRKEAHSPKLNKSGKGWKNDLLNVDLTAGYRPSRKLI